VTPTLASLRLFLWISFKIVVFAVGAWLMGRGAVRYVGEGGLTTVVALLYGVIALAMLGFLTIQVVALVLLLRGAGDD
jgi:hypothetical protein